MGKKERDIEKNMQEVATECLPLIFHHLQASTTYMKHAHRHLSEQISKCRLVLHGHIFFHPTPLCVAGAEVDKVLNLRQQRVRFCRRTSTLSTKSTEIKGI